MLKKAHALEARGRPDLAIQLWQQILLSDPRNTAALAGLAKDYKLIGSDSLANQTLARLYAINPNDPNLAGTPAKSNSSPSPIHETRQPEGSSLSTPPIASTPSIASPPPTTSPNPPSPSDRSAIKIALNTPSATAPSPSGQQLDEKAPSARDAASGAYSAPQPKQPPPPQPTQPDSSASSSANTSSTQTTVPVRPPSKPAPAKPRPAAPTPVIAQSNHRLPGKSTRQYAQQSAPQSRQPQKQQPTQTLPRAPLGVPEIATPNSGPAPTEAQTQFAPAQPPQPEITSGATCLNTISEPIGVYAGGNTSIDYLVSLFTARIQWKADDDNQNAFTRGPGGYFNPQAYFLANAPLSWQGNYGARWHHNFASAFDTQAFHQYTIPLLPITDDKALETSQNNPTLPNLPSISPDFDLDSHVAYQIATHWFTGAFLATNNTCNFPYISDGFFGRYTVRQQPFSVAAPAGLFSAAAPRLFTVP